MAWLYGTNGRILWQDGFWAKYLIIRLISLIAFVLLVNSPAYTESAQNGFTQTSIQISPHTLYRFECVVKWNTNIFFEWTECVFPHRGLYAGYNWICVVVPSHRWFKHWDGFLRLLCAGSQSNFEWITSHRRLAGPGNTDPCSIHESSNRRFFQRGNDTFRARKRFMSRLRV